MTCRPYPCILNQQQIVCRLFRWCRIRLTPAGIICLSILFSSGHWHHELPKANVSAITPSILSEDKRSSKSNHIVEVCINSKTDKCSPLTRSARSVAQPSLSCHFSRLVDAHCTARNVSAIAGPQVLVVAPDVVVLADLLAKCTMWTSTARPVVFISPSSHSSPQATGQCTAWTATAPAALR